MPQKPQSRRTFRAMPPARVYTMVAAFVVLYLGLGFLHPIPLWVAALYGGLSVVAFAAYAVDKSAARADRRRIPERTLLLLGLLGGWPGALIAQASLRHKTQKVSFQRPFWVSVAINLLVFVVFASQELFPG